MIKIKQTEDKELLEEILEQLKKHGGHCPCQFDDASKNTICICSSFREEINNTPSGEVECPCGRYTAVITADKTI